MTCADGGCRVGDLPVIPAAERAARKLWTAAIDIDPLRPYIYDGCTDIVFPIHTSPKFASQVGLPGIILQGTATLAMAASQLVDREADCRPDRLKTISCRFTGMVLPGTRIEICLVERRSIPEGTALFFEVRNNEGKRAVSDGYALIA